MSVLEAMAHGTVPVVAHCRSGVDEVIRQGENGFLVPVGDIEGFTDRICDLAKNPQQLAQMSEAARKTISTGGFNIADMTDSYLQVMGQVVSKPFFRPVTGVLRPDHIPEWRSWLPPALPGPSHAIYDLKKRVKQTLKRMV